MARSSEDQPVIPSILERLSDSDPRRSTESRDRYQQLRELKASVKRDLEQLLNTRQRCLSPPPGMPNLKTSLVNYGIPDFVGVKSSTLEKRKELARIIEEVIRAFETRFLRVKVKLASLEDQQDRILRFHIEGLLRADPAPVPVVYHSSVESATGNVEVRDAD